MPFFQWERPPAGPELSRRDFRNSFGFNGLAWIIGVRKEKTKSGLTSWKEEIVTLRMQDYYVESESAVEVK